MACGWNRGTTYQDEPPARETTLPRERLGPTVWSAENRTGQSTWKCLYRTLRASLRLAVICSWTPSSSSKRAKAAPIDVGTAYGCCLGQGKPGAWLHLGTPDSTTSQREMLPSTVPAAPRFHPSHCLTRSDAACVEPVPSQGPGPRCVLAEASGRTHHLWPRGPECPLELEAPGVCQARGSPWWTRWHTDHRAGTNSAALVASEGRSNHTAPLPAAEGCQGLYL